MIVRAERPEDAAAVRAVVAAAFARADEAELVDRLRRNGDGVLSLVAVAADVILGHVLFSRMTAPFRALGLAPVSVLPERQGSGVGTRLISEGLARAAQDGWEGVFVVGEPSFYQRFGFEAELASGFECVYAGPYFMVRALSGDLPALSGKVAYAHAFDEM